MSQSPLLSFENLEHFTWLFQVEKKGKHYLHYVLKIPANCTSTGVLAFFRGLYICFVQLPRGFVNGSIFRTKYNNKSEKFTQDFLKKRL